MSSYYSGVCIIHPIIIEEVSIIQRSVYHRSGVRIISNETEVQVTYHCPRCGSLVSPGQFEKMKEGSD